MYIIIQSTALWKTVSLEIVFIEFFFIKIEGYPPVNIQEILGEGFVILKVNP